MEIGAPNSYITNVKRYMRRRKYRKLSVDNKKKMRVERLGGRGPNGTTSPPRRVFKLRKLRVLKFVMSPMTLLVKIQGAYVDLMVRLAGNIAGARRIAGGSKKVAKVKDMVSVVADEQSVDARLVMEIYKRLAASRQLSMCGDLGQSNQAN